MAKKKQPSTTTKTPADITKQSHAFAPSARIFNDWNPALLRAAERTAEHGNLSTAVSICEWMLADDRIVATLDARIDGLMGLPVSFEAGKGTKADAALKAIDEGDDWWSAYSEAELKSILRWGILLGVAPARHRWPERPDHEGRLLPCPEFWYPQTLRCDLQQRKWFTRDAHNVEHEIVAGDGEWILHTPGGSNRPWSQGLWRSLGPWVLLKAYARQDWARHGEKGNILAATSPLNSTPDQRRELAQQLRESGTNRVVALAAGFDLKNVETTANTRNLYEAQVNAANAAIAILVRGGNLSTEVSDVGSKAAAESQAKTGDLPKRKADAQGLSTTLHEQSLSVYALWNFGDAFAAPWPVWPVEPEEDMAARATMVDKLADGLTKFDKLGFDIDDKATIEEFGLTFLKGRSREREPDPVPTAPGQGQAEPEGDADKTSTKKSAGAGGKAPKAQQSASAPRLAADGGFVNGQLYADDLVDSGTKLGAKALEAHIDDILAAIEESDDYPSLRANVLKRWGDRMQPAELRTVLARCLELAEMAGHFAVKVDAT